MNLSSIILKDVRSQLDSSKFRETMNQVGDEYDFSIRKMNVQGLEPDGTRRFGLVDSYADYKRNIGRQPIPDFLYTGTADEDFMYQPKKRGVSFGYNSARVGGYMRDHEEGNGVPQRRQFPIEEDSDSSEQQTNISDVKDIIFELLNEQRTINADLFINIGNTSKGSITVG
tara:strand:+ start:403 stop:915 length:513 start_codon:yes stop_codon:yes gene_type:complete